MYLEEVLLTARVILVASASCFVIGIPAVLFGVSVCRIRADARDVWFYGPLVGAGFIVLFCQNLLYLDVIISTSAILLWLLAAAGWTWVLSFLPFAKCSSRCRGQHSFSALRFIFFTPAEC